MQRSNTCQSRILCQSVQGLSFLFVFSLLFLVLILPSNAANIQSSTPIKIGVLAKRGHERALEKWGATADYLTRKIPGQYFKIVPLDFEGVRLAAMSQSIDFLITNSSYYVALEFDHGLSRIATLANLHGDVPQHVFGGVIFTRADRADIDALKDLSGKSFWAVDRESLGGWLAAWRVSCAKY